MVTRVTILMAVAGFSFNALGQNVNVVNPTVKVGNGLGPVNVILRDTTGAYVAAGGGGGGGGDASAANQATQITAEQAILAKIIAAPATSAKQDTQITAEQAILAKIIAAPATEAKQDTGNTSLSAIATNTSKAGAANLATGQVATSTTAATWVVARPTRRSVTLKNLSTTITVYYGPATVTTANGMELKPGESESVDWVGLIQVIAASGTPTVAYSDTYD